MNASVSRFRSWLRPVAVSLLALALAPAQVHAQGGTSLLPLNRGEVVMTHSSMMNPLLIDTTHPVVRLFDIRDPNATGDFPPNGSNFPAPADPAYTAAAERTAAIVRSEGGIEAACDALESHFSLRV